MGIFLLQLMVSVLWVNGAAVNADVKLQTLFQRDDVIWGFDFLKDRRIVFTERGGRMGVFDPKSSAVVMLKGVPQVVARGQGGMLDVRAHPDGEWVYMTYSEPVGRAATTALARAKIKGDRLTDLQKLFSAHEPGGKGIHFGSRIEFHDGFVFITVGDRDQRERAQELGYHNGKILRLTLDGKPAPGNPFARRPGARPEIWSYGHRNPQGLVAVRSRSELWSAEFGPRGGDELNRITPGKNYGWPVITYGREYWGPKIGEGAKKDGMEQPVVQWTPSISPSALTYYDGDRHPRWKGSFLLACLSGQHVRRVKLGAGGAAEQEILLKDSGKRFRNIRSGPDGEIYVSTDDGLLARLIP